MAIEWDSHNAHQQSASRGAHVVEVVPDVKKFAGGQSIVLGLVLIAAAVFGIVFNIVDLAVGLSSVATFTWGVVGHGFWTGLACAVAGSFGIVAALRTTRFYIIAFNVSCFIAASLSVAEFSIAIIAAAIVGVSCRNIGSRQMSINCPTKDTLIAMEVLLAIVALIEAVAATWGAVISCMIINCCSNRCRYDNDDIQQAEIPLDDQLSTRQTVADAFSADTTLSWYIPTQSFPQPGRQVGESNAAYGYNGQTLNPDSIDVQLTYQQQASNSNLYDIMTSEYFSK